MSETQQSRLHAYHDGELGWWARIHFERSLRRSAGLRRELDHLRELRAAADADERAEPSPDLWGAISTRLGAIDAEVAAPVRSAAIRIRRDTGPRRVPGREASSWWRPLPLGAAALATAGAVALALVLQQGGPEALPAPPSGTVRFLDTSGRAVMVTERPDDVTIIWLIGDTSGPI
jgi:hypothetical protein